MGGWVGGGCFCRKALETMPPLSVCFCRKALENMPPLSLGVSSSERPQFLSRHVLEEMETFLTDLTTSVHTSSVFSVGFP